MAAISLHFPPFKAGPWRHRAQFPASATVKVCPASWDGLTGVSPVRVVAKQPGSWWPAERETRLSKRHDKAALGGEQATSPYDRNLAASHGNDVEAEPLFTGRRPWTARRSWSAQRLCTHHGGRNGCTVHHGTGEIRLGAGVVRMGVTLRHNVIVGKGEAYKQLDC